VKRGGGINPKKGERGRAGTDLSMYERKTAKKRSKPLGDRMSARKEKGRCGSLSNVRGKRKGEGVVSRRRPVGRGGGVYLSGGKRRRGRPVARAKGTAAFPHYTERPYPIGGGRSACR